MTVMMEKVSLFWLLSHVGWWSVLMWAWQDFESTERWALKGCLLWVNWCGKTHLHRSQSIPWAGIQTCVRWTKGKACSASWCNVNQLPLASMAVVLPPPHSIHTYTHHDGLWFELWTRINSLSLLASVRAFYHSDRKRNRYITKLCQESQLHVSKFLNFCLSFCFSAQKNANSFWFCLCLRISKASFFFLSP